MFWVEPKAGIRKHKCSDLHKSSIQELNLNLARKPLFCHTNVLVAQIKYKYKFVFCVMQGRKDFTPQLFYELSHNELVTLVKSWFI